MSDPPHPAPPAAPPSPSRPARWLDRLSVLLLCVGLGGAIAAAAPAIFRAAVQPPPSAEATAPPPVPTLPPAQPRGTGYAFDDHPRFAPDDDDPRATDLERLYPDGMWPGHAARDRKELKGPSTKAQKGHAVSPLIVREKADPAASTTGQVPAGESIMVIREEGPWALIVHQGSSGVTIGWTKRSGIAMP